MVTDTFTLVNTPDFKRAYAIHGKHYDGEPVTPGDQEFFSLYVKNLVAVGLDGFGLGVRLWLVYAWKYIDE